MKVGFSLVRIPIEREDKIPRQKEGADLLILATWGCHPVGGCQVKLWGTSKAGKREVVYFPCELETCYLTAWSSLDQRQIKSVGKSNLPCLLASWDGAIP